MTAANKVMEYSSRAIQQAFQEFWKSAKDSICYILNGVEFVPDAISSFNIQLIEGDYGEGFNFICQALNLRIMHNGTEVPYTAEFVIKVTLSFIDDKPVEKVSAIKNNCIYLKI